LGDSLELYPGVKGLEQRREGTKGKAKGQFLAGSITWVSRKGIDRRGKTRVLGGGGGVLLYCLILEFRSGGEDAEERGRDIRVQIITSRGTRRRIDEREEGRIETIVVLIPSVPREEIRKDWKMEGNPIIYLSRILID